MSTQAPAPPLVLASHAFRSTIGSPELTYTLYPDALVVTSEHPGPPAVYPLASIRRVHLKYDRGKVRQYFWCVIHTERGKLTLRHSHFAGLANVEDRRASYTPFVLRLLQQVQGNPGVRFTAGSWGNFIGLLVLLVPMALLIVFAASIGRVGTALAAGVLALVALLNLGRMRPRTFTADAPPRGLLPL
jgi:hypothetical protein